MPKMKNNQYNFHLFLVIDYESKYLKTANFKESYFNPKFKNLTISYIPNKKGMRTTKLQIKKKVFVLSPYI